MANLLRRNRNFRLLFSATTVSNLGDGVSMVALPWLATLFTRDAFLIGVVAMAGRLPWLLLTLPAGVLTDRVDRRLLIVRAGLLRMVLTLGVVALILTLPALPLAAGQGTGPILALAVIAFLLGSAEVLGDNAAQTLLPTVVDKADLERANGQMYAAEQVMGQFIGPPLAGLLIGAGIAVPFGFDAATFGLAAACIWLIALPPRVPPPPQRFGAALAEGVRWMLAHRAILRLALMLGCVNALYIAVLTVLVLFAQDVLGLDAVGYGLLLTAGAAGGVLGGLAAPRICAALGLRHSMAAAFAAFALGYLMIALTSDPVVAGAALAIEAAGSMVWNVATVSYRQRVIPDAVLGRVNSIYRFFGWGSMPLGALAGGAIVSLASGPLGLDAALRLPFWIAFAGCVALFAYAMSRLRLD